MGLLLCLVGARHGPLAQAVASKLWRVLLLSQAACEQQGLAVVIWHGLRLGAALLRGCYCSSGASGAGHGAMAG